MTETWGEGCGCQELGVRVVGLKIRVFDWTLGVRVIGVRVRVRVIE